MKNLRTKYYSNVLIRTYFTCIRFDDVFKKSVGEMGWQS